MAWRGSFSVYGEGIRCACGPWLFSCLISIAFARWALVHGTIFLVRGVTLSMAGNARKGPHCVGIVFLCQKWRLGGLFFAGWSFAMKSMLPPIRQNVFLAAGQSAFLELLTLQKGPIVPFSVTTPLLGRNGRFEGARRRCACSSPAVCLTLRYVLLVACRSLPISRFCQSLSAVCRLASAVCRLASGACHSVWPLPSAPGLSALSLAASPWRLLLFVRVALSVAFCERSLFLLSPYVEPPQLPCGVNASETHITLRCNMRVTFVKRCTHTLETLHSLPSPCGAAHRHAPVATRPPRLELPGLGQWGK